MAPEHPALAVELKVNDASEWERFIHSTLSLNGQRIPDALGTEWFTTSAAEIQEIYEAKMVEVERARRRADAPNLAVVQGEDS